MRGAGQSRGCAPARVVLCVWESVSRVALAVQMGGGTGELVGWTGRLVVGRLGVVEVRSSAMYLGASRALRAMVER